MSLLIDEKAAATRAPSKLPERQTLILFCVFARVVAWSTAAKRCASFASIFQTAAEVIRARR